MRTYNSLTEIKDANKALGHFFFSNGAKRFFNSRDIPGVMRGCYFVTSEAYNNGDKPLYSVRMVLPNGEIETVGKFNSFKTVKAARAMVRDLPNQLQDALQLAKEDFNGKKRGEFLKHALIEPSNDLGRSFSMDSFCGACTWLVINGKDYGFNFMDFYHDQYKEYFKQEENQ